MTTTYLAAACGIYCGSCAFYRAFHDQNQALKENLAKLMNLSTERIECYGCHSPSGCTIGDVFWGQKDCPIKQCARNRNHAFCYECADFPCGDLNALKEEMLKKIRVNVVENLKHMKEVDVEKWLQEQDALFTCSTCRQKLSSYDVACPQCGGKIDR